MWVMVDIEADGPCPGLFSMIELGAVIVTKDVNDIYLPQNQFYANFKAITDNYVQAALDVTNVSREATFLFKDPDESMKNFHGWLDKHIFSLGKPYFISDNNGFDWSFVNYYFWKYQGCNPFGHSSTNLGSLYKGIRRTMFESFEYLRKTSHSHNPLDDAIGNAEVFHYMIDNMGLKITL